MYKKQNYMKKLLLIGISCIIALSISSCYRDNEEELYNNPGGSGCDTVAVSYSAEVAPILNNSCNMCHSDANANSLGAGIRLAGHANLTNFLSNNKSRFLSAIKHDGMASNMPKGGSKLPNCDIQKIEAWINSGVPNN